MEISGYSTNSNTAVSDTPIKITYEQYAQLSDYQKEDKCFLVDTSAIYGKNLGLIFSDTISTISDPSNEIVYIHKTNCPNCGSLLDGDENSPYVKCASCGAKIWSEREVIV